MCKNTDQKVNGPIYRKNFNNINWNDNKKQEDAMRRQKQRMVKFLRLVCNGEVPVFINPNGISFISVDEDNGTMIASQQGMTIIVKETIDEVKEKLSDYITFVD